MVPTCGVAASFAATTVFTEAGADHLGVVRAKANEFLARYAWQGELFAQRLAHTFLWRRTVWMRSDRAVEATDDELHQNKQCTWRLLVLAHEE